MGAGRISRGGRSNARTCGGKSISAARWRSISWSSSIRADFPHDKHWKRATLVFSDGSRKPIDLEKTPAPQTVVFPPRKTTSVRLVDLVQDEPLGWCALTEVEVWGRDPVAVAADLDAPSEDR